MSSDREAALAALHAAEAALEQLEHSPELSTPADEPVAVAETPAVHTKFLDLGPTYLGPVAVNGG